MTAISEGILVQLSGEHEGLPRAELFSVLKGENIPHKVLWDDGGKLILIEVETDRFDFLQRTGMVRRVLRKAFSSDELKDAAVRLTQSMDKKKSFAVRCKCLDERNSLEVERELGSLISESGFQVDLKTPGVTVGVLSDGRILAGLVVPLEKSFEERRAQNRPFFSPTSMHPKIARTLVNLACIGTGANVYDPFCGTGGILIEAALSGMRIRGSDIDERMVVGCRENLAHYGLAGNVFCADALRMAKDETVDAVVTDPPYGRSSFCSKKELGKFYLDFVASAASLLESKKRMVIVLPKGHVPDSQEFEIIDNHDLRVHKSLTRSIWVLQKK